tara:strand:- start:265 stop:498 length:234 start_codon:yes stop_codon:yes gene_type:complete
LKEIIIFQQFFLVLPKNDKTTKDTVPSAIYVVKAATLIPYGGFVVSKLINTKNKTDVLSEFRGLKFGARCFPLLHRT